MQYTPMVGRVLRAVDAAIKADPGLSDRKISLNAGLNATFVRDLRNGESGEPRRRSVEKLAAVLGYNAAWFWDGTGPQRGNTDDSPLSAIARESQALDEEDQEVVLDLILRLRRRGKPAA